MVDIEHWIQYDFQVWPQSEYPLLPVGRMVLNRNPKNYFAEVEQIAFSPAHMISGVEASPDKMLQVGITVESFYYWYRRLLSHL